MPYAKIKRVNFNVNRCVLNATHICTGCASSIDLKHSAEGEIEIRAVLTNSGQLLLFNNGCAHWNGLPCTCERGSYRRNCRERTYQTEMLKIAKINRIECMRINIIELWIENIDNFEYSKRRGEHCVYFVIETTILHFMWCSVIFAHSLILLSFTVYTMTVKCHVTK